MSTVVTSNLNYLFLFLHRLRWIFVDTIFWSEDENGSPSNLLFIHLVYEYVVYLSINIILGRCMSRVSPTIFRI